MSDKWKVCPDCDGDGNDKDSEMVFTAEMVDEWYADQQEDRDDFVRAYRGGQCSQLCRTCGGQRVVSAAEYAEILEEIDYRHEVEMVRRAESGWSW